MENELNTQGKRIAFARNQVNMTQTQFASALGVAQQAVQNWEGDKNKSKYLSEIENITGVFAEWIKSGNGPIKKAWHLNGDETEKEIQILNLYREAPEAIRDIVDKALEMVKTGVKNQKKAKKL